MVSMCGARFSPFCMLDQARQENSHLSATPNMLEREYKKKDGGERRETTKMRRHVRGPHVTPIKIEYSEYSLIHLILILQKA